MILCFENSLKFFWQFLSYFFLCFKLIFLLCFCIIVLKQYVDIVSGCNARPKKLLNLNFKKNIFFMFLYYFLIFFLKIYIEIMSGWEARLKKLKKVSFFSLLQINIRLISFLYFKLIRLCLILRFKNSLKTIWQFWSFFSLLQINIFIFYFFVLFVFKCWHCVWLRRQT